MLQNIGKARLEGKFELEMDPPGDVIRPTYFDPVHQTFKVHIPMSSLSDKSCTVKFYVIQNDEILTTFMWDHSP